MKEWKCICGSRVFVLTRLESLIVNFGEEGAIPGHPRVNKSSMGKSSLVCSSCHTRVPDVVADDMLKEII